MSSSSLSGCEYQTTLLSGSYAPDGLTVHCEHRGPATHRHAPYLWVLKEGRKAGERIVSNATYKKKQWSNS